MGTDLCAIMQSTTCRGQGQVSIGCDPGSVPAMLHSPLHQQHVVSEGLAKDQGVRIWLRFVVVRQRDVDSFVLQGRR